MNILGSRGILPSENLKFRSSKTAAKVPKTPILSNTQPLYGHTPVFWYKKWYCTRCTQLKLALRARDLVEFYHTLQSGVGVESWELQRNARLLYRFDHTNLLRQTEKCIYR